MSNQKKDDDQTSAPAASKVGSLLAGLLNDVKQSVAQEAKQIETEADKRAREEREVRDREEGRKREAAQQKLIEETRRRNEALSRRERGEHERKAFATAPHMRPLSEAPQAPKSAELLVAAPAHKPTSKLMLAALVVLGVGLGLGTSLALQPSTYESNLDIGAAAKALTATMKKQASVETKIRADLAEAQKQIGDLQKAVGMGEGAHKGLAEQLKVLKADFEKTRSELEALKAAQADPKGPKRNGPGPTGVPNINGSIFNK